MAQNNDQSLADVVYRNIKTGIINLSYPPGSFVTEALIAEEYGVSRMPVRIAVRRLVSEGWLIGDFRRKIRVKQFTEQDIRDIYQLRQMLESLALKQIFDEDKTWEYSFLIEEKLLRMRASRDDYYAFELADAELHSVVVNIFHNQRIEHIYADMQDQLVWISSYMLKEKEMDPTYMQQIIDGVGELVLAIREKRFADALFIYRRDHIEGGLSPSLQAIGVSI